MKKINQKAILKTPLSLDFELGRTKKELKETLKFKKGTFIKLDKSEKDVIQVYVNGRKYALGKLLRKDGELYVKMTDLLRGDK